MERLISFLGIFIFLSVAVVFSENRKQIRWKETAMGLVLQFIIGGFIIWSPFGQELFLLLNQGAAKLIGFSNEGAKMVFGENFRDHFFAFSVLPSIIFMAAIMAVLFHWGVLQKIVKGFTLLMKKTLRTSGAESMGCSANIFVGGLEACFSIRPFVPQLSRSELLTISVAGLSTIAAGVLTVYAGMGISAGHLLNAQILSALGALIVGKILIPEPAKTQKAVSTNETKAEIQRDLNTLEAACRGSVEGVKVAAAVCGTLITFVAFTALLNGLLSTLPPLGDHPLSLERILGWIFTPVALLTGIEWKDCALVGSFFGKKIFLNEFLAFLDMKDSKTVLSERSFTIATYFICGFGNFSALAMQVSGLGSMCPEKKHEIAKLAGKILLGATITSLVSACIAGTVIPS